MFLKEFWQIQYDPTWGNFGYMTEFLYAESFH